MWMIGIQSLYLVNTINHLRSALWLRTYDALLTHLRSSTKQELNRALNVAATPP